MILRKRVYSCQSAALSHPSASYRGSKKHMPNKPVQTLFGAESRELANCALITKWQRRYQVNYHCLHCSEHVNISENDHKFSCSWLSGEPHALNSSSGVSDQWCVCLRVLTLVSMSEILHMIASSL